jgi:hypothetical protein
VARPARRPTRSISIDGIDRLMSLSSVEQSTSCCFSSEWPITYSTRNVLHNIFILSFLTHEFTGSINVRSFKRNYVTSHKETSVRLRWWVMHAWVFFNKSRDRDIYSAVRTSTGMQDLLSLVSGLCYSRSIVLENLTVAGSLQCTTTVPPLPGPWAAGNASWSGSEARERLR